MRYMERIEKALRAAALKIVGTASPENLVFELKDEAKLIAEKLLPSDSDTSQYAEDIRKQNHTIDELVESMSTGLSSVTHNTSTRRELRASFDSDRDNGISTFLVPILKGSQSFSAEEAFVKKYLTSLKEFELLQYSGIKEISKDFELLVTYSFFHMRSDNIMHAQRASFIDTANSSINRYLDTTVKDKIKGIDTEFEEEGSVVSYATWAWQKENYLNGLRSYELFLYSSSNIMWFISNVVNEQGIQLSLNDKILLCEKITTFFNEITQYINQSELNNKKELCSVAADITAKVNFLKEAFDEALNNQDSLMSVNQIIDKSIVDLNEALSSLVFRDTFPDPFLSPIHKLRSFVDTVQGLGCSIRQNRPFMADFRKKLRVGLPIDTVVNQDVITVIDLLIIFSHASALKRLKLINELSQQPNLDANQFSQNLLKLNNEFIEPLYQLNLKKGDLSSLFDKHRHKKVAEITAKKLIPLFYLALETCQVTLAPQAVLAQQQMDRIKAMDGFTSAYYYWSSNSLTYGYKKQHLNISFLMEKLSTCSLELKALGFLSDMQRKNPKLKNDVPCLRFLEATYLKIQAEFLDVKRKLSTLDDFFASSVRNIFNGIEICLTDALTGIDNALNNPTTERLTDCEKSACQSDLNEFNQLYLKLFNKETGISDFKALVHNEVNEWALEEIIIDSAPCHVTQSLMSLIKACQEGMSCLNTNNLFNKVEALNYLSSIVSESQRCTLIEAKHLLNDLAKIVMSNRPSMFFESLPGETLSAKVLYREMLRLKWDDDFPIAKLLLGNEFDIYSATEADICKAMQQKFLFRPILNSTDGIERTAELESAVTLSH